MDGKSDVEMHHIYLSALLKATREHKLYANLKKCIFGAPEIPVRGNYVGTNGVRPDPEKLKAIQDWPTHQNQKDLRSFLGVTTDLHKFSKNHAHVPHALTQL